MSAPTRAKTSRTQSEAVWNCAENMNQNILVDALAEVIRPDPIMLYKWLERVVDAQQSILGPFPKLLGLANAKLEWDETAQGISYGKDLKDHHQGVGQVIYNTYAAIRSSSFDDKEPEPVKEAEDAEDPMDCMF